MALNTAQTDFLTQPIAENRVEKDGKGMRHVAAWDIRRHLLRIFGWGGFDIETKRIELLSQVESKPGAWTVVYVAEIRLTIKDPSGRILATFEDGATGDAQNQRSLGDAHDLAMKGLALDTIIPTPTGWATMESLKVGDVVIDKDGQPVRVNATSPVKNIGCYRVTFQNGRSIVCDEEHLWLATIAQETQKVHTIGELYDAKQAGKPVVLPVAAPVQLPAVHLPIDPWVLGYWLGNGSKSAPRLTSHADDTDEVVAAIRSAGYEVRSVRPHPQSRATEIGIRGVKKLFADLGLLGNKHIPQQYLRASIEQRRALLAGLMDSDGTVGKKDGRVTFTGTCEKLRDSVTELARSLGERVTNVQIQNTGYGKTVTSYNAQWRPIVIPFALSRKTLRSSVRSKRSWHSIASIEKVDSVPTRCISVDSPSRTFLAGEDMVPTHNSALSGGLKRCAVNLGDQFGLSLYAKGITGPVVGRTLATAPVETTQSHDELLSTLNGIANEAESRVELLVLRHVADAADLLTAQAYDKDGNPEPLETLLHRRDAMMKLRDQKPGFTSTQDDDLMGGVLA